MDPGSAQCGNRDGAPDHPKGLPGEYLKDVLG